MKWFGRGQMQGDLAKHSPSRAEFLAEQKQRLYWAALMITGDANSAELSIVNAGGLAETDNFEFRDWLVRWGRSATARVAVSAVRSSIQETAAQYTGCTCLHGAHVLLAPDQIQNLYDLDPCEVIPRLDILARSVLVLYGCDRASISECALLLNVPRQLVLAAYCRALQWYRKVAAPVAEIRQARSSRLFLVRHDSDGVPVWDSQSSTA